MYLQIYSPDVIQPISFRRSGIVFLRTYVERVYRNDISAMLLVLTWLFPQNLSSQQNFFNQISANFSATLNFFRFVQIHGHSE